MVKAHIVTSDGTTITLEGTNDEVASLMDRFNVQRGNTANNAPAAIAPTKVKVKSKKITKSSSKTSLPGLMSRLMEDGFFKKPKQLNVVKKALEEQGHYYANDRIAITLLREVKKRNLRRIKENKNWVYVG